MSLRARILLLVAIAVLVPALALGAYFFEIRRATIETAKQDLAALSRLSTGLVDSRSRDVERVLYLLSLAPPLDTPDRDACSSFLAQTLPRSAMFSTVFTVSLGGELHCYNAGARSGQNLADRRYFKEAIERSGVAYDVIVGRVTGKPQIIAALAARDPQGRPKFVIGGGFFLDALAAEILSAAAHESTVVRIWDRGGGILVDARRGNSAPSLAGKSFPDSPLFRWALSARTGDTTELHGLRGRPQAWAMARLPDAVGDGLRITVGVPLAELSAAADRAFQQALTVLLVTALGVFAGAYVLAERGIRGSIARVVRVAQRHGAGDVGARIGAPYPSGELGTLMASLDATAERLESHVKRVGALLTATPDPIVIVDAEGRIFDINAQSERAFGYAREELLGQPVEILIPARLRGDHAAHRARYVRESPQPRAMGTAHELRARRKDGSEFPVDVSLSPYSTEHGTLVIAAVRDVTARHREERQQAAERLVLEGVSTAQPLAQTLTLIVRSIEAQLTDARCSILLLDADGQCLRTGAAPSLPAEYNQAIDGVRIGPRAGSCGTAAHRNERVIVADIASDPLWADYAPLALQHGLRACWSSPVRSGAAGEVLATFAVYYGEPRAPGQADVDLADRWVQLTAIAIERKRAEDEIRALNADLERRVEQRTAELERANVQLEQASRLKTEFLASMSHELRTPLNAVIGFSEVLQDGLAGELSDKQKQFAGDILDAGRHLLSLINDILDLSKVEAGMVQLDLGPVAIEPLLASALTVVKERAAAHRVSLALEVEPGLPPILADGRKLKQIVYNLASNAVKFTPGGGRVTLAARAAARAAVAPDPALPGRLLPLAPGPDERFVEIAVRDTGVGIEEGDLARLFEPFVQIDSSLARRHAGTGLGLSLSRRLAELHGGTVGVASRAGEGTVFSVWIPCRVAAGAAVPQVEPAPADTAAEAGPARRALVVEDDDAAAKLIGDALSAEGFEVMRAATAEEGLVRAGKSLPQLITLDVVLPHMDGWEFLQQLRADPRLAGVPVVIVSVSHDVEHGFALGAARVLQKPFVREELVRALAGIVPRQAAGGARARVLVVDDNPHAVELLEAHLAPLPVEVLRAYSGREAIDAARRVAPDAVVLDILMPGMSGFEVIEALKASTATAQIPVIVVTAKDLSAQERERLRADVVSVASKSQLDASLFRAEVRRAVQRPAEDA